MLKKIIRQIWIIPVSGFLLIACDKSSTALPEKDMIAYAYGKNEFSLTKIHIVDAITGEKVREINTRFFDVEPKWNPNGEKLLISSRRAKGFRYKDVDSWLYIYDLKTGKEDRIYRKIIGAKKRWKDDMKSKGYTIQIYKSLEYEYSMESHQWLSNDLIGFAMKPYILSSGKSWPSAPFTYSLSGDSLSSILKFKSDRKYFFAPIWVSIDSIIIRYAKNYYGKGITESYMWLLTSKEDSIKYETLDGPINYKIWSADPFLQNNHKFVVTIQYFQYYSDVPKVAIVELKDEMEINVLAEGSYPTVSPDGGKIAFVKEGDIHILDLNTMEIKRLTFDGGIKMNLDWSPM